MQKIKYTLFAIALLVFFFSITIILYGSSGGRTGRTLKTSTQGCGSCHGSSATADVSVVLSGPDTVVAGQTMGFSLTVSKPSKTGAGLDIATRNGVLAPVSTNIHLASGELTHNNNIPMSGGSATVQFNYTAPGTPGIDTLWATGLATNSSGGTDGDDWNWATSKRITVVMATGISSNNSITNDFRLYQNFPNPFNPVTKISYELAVSEFVTLKIYNTNGMEIAELVSQKQNPGKHEIDLNAADLSSGIYFYAIKAGNFKETRRMMLIK